jgi:hypothetical protein
MVEAVLALVVWEERLISRRTHRDRNPCLVLSRLASAARMRRASCAYARPLPPRLREENTTPCVSAEYNRQSIGCKRMPVPATTFGVMGASQYQAFAKKKPRYCGAELAIRRVTPSVSMRTCSNYGRARHRTEFAIHRDLNITVATEVGMSIEIPPRQHRSGFYISSSFRGLTARGGLNSNGSC